MKTAIEDLGRDAEPHWADNWQDHYQDECRCKAPGEDIVWGVLGGLGLWLAGITVYLVVVSP